MQSVAQVVIILDDWPLYCNLPPRKRQNIQSQRIGMWLGVFAILFTPAHVFAQQATAQTEPVDEEFIDLNLAGQVSLPKIVEAFSKLLDVRFLHTADLSNRQVTVYTPARLPASAMPALLGSLLKGENLAIVDSDVPGWKRIVDVADIVKYAKPGEAIEVLSRDGPAAVVTQVIPIKNADMSKLATTLRPFLTQPGGSFIVQPENQLIIVTDYAGNVKAMAEMLKLIDRPSSQATIDFYVTKNRTPASLIEQAQELLQQQSPTPKSGGSSDVKLFNDASGRRVIVAGKKDRVERTLLLLKKLDTGMGFLTRVYRFQNVSAERIDKLVRGLVRSEEAETAIQTTIDAEGNLLIVQAAADVHSQIELLVKELDRPVDSSESPIQFYKLKNANAIEVLFSLLALQQAAGIGQQQQAGGFGQFGTLGGTNVGGVNQALGIGGFNQGVNQAGFGANRFGGTGNGIGAFRGDTGGQTIRMPFADGNADDTTRRSIGQNQNSALGSLIGGANTGLAGAGGGGQVVTLPGGARVSADVATNSLIVFAPASVQPLYEKLIRSLDQRRPQVLIEAEIIAVDTTDNFSLGVEVSLGDRSGTSRLFKFTSFGLSEVDATTGALTQNPALGFNGVLVDPDVADVIVQALSRHTKSRVLASPQILVNDNSTGTLESVASVPFRSINTINTISSESLGGDQQAGTTITVTPHINEDDHLQLEFEVEFSTFTGQGGANLPPPRQIDRVGSVVTIPDGKTVVVGGLKRISESQTFAGVPWAEKVPLLRELTSISTEEDTTTSFFLFIRPTILRDSRFRDLQYLSDIEAQHAETSGDEPISRPILMPCMRPPTQTVRQPSSVLHH